MRLWAAAVAVALSTGSSASAAAPTGTWRGTFALPASAGAVTMSVELRGTSATVVLGAGHPVRTVGRVTRRSVQVAFAVPGRPTPLRFTGRVRGRTLGGTVSQGQLRGSFRLRRGAPLEARSVGLYALADGGSLAVAENSAAGRTALLLDDGEVRKLTLRGAGRYEVGAGFAARASVAGELRFSGTSVSGRFGAVDVSATRVPLRQEEIRFRGPAGWLAGTLTLPPGAGPHPAVAFAHGAGASRRDLLSTFALFLARHGVATLALDKRGIGQSTGVWPGESASPSAIDAYARDLEAAARFLAAQRDVDPDRVGRDEADRRAARPR